MDVGKLNASLDEFKFLAVEQCKRVRSTPENPYMLCFEQWSFRGESDCQSSSLLLAPQLRQHAVVFQRGRVADGFFAGGDVAQEAAHDFAAAGFGQGGGEADVVGLRPGRRFPCGRGASVPSCRASLGSPALSVTKTATASPLISSAGRRPRLRPRAGWLTRALSISIVLRRWPATLSTSSMRPMIQ